MVYESIEPFGDRRGDLQAGIISATVRNTVAAAVGSNNNMLGPLDFIPDWDKEPPKPLTPEEEFERQVKMWDLLRRAQEQILEEKQLRAGAQPVEHSGTV